MSNEADAASMVSMFVPTPRPAGTERRRQTSATLIFETLRAEIVALDLPTSWILTAPTDEFTGRMFAAVNAMMLDVLAAVARKDYEDRRRRQAEGTAKAKAAGLYKGRPENKTRNAAISSLLRDGRSWRDIMDATGCSRTLLAKIARDRRLQAEADAAIRAAESVAHR